jgi:hypothetical protein
MCGIPGPLARCRLKPKHGSRSVSVGRGLRVTSRRQRPRPRPNPRYPCRQPTSRRRFPASPTTVHSQAGETKPPGRRHQSSLPLLRARPPTGLPSKKRPCHSPYWCGGWFLRSAPPGNPPTDRLGNLPGRVPFERVSARLPEAAPRCQNCPNHHLPSCLHETGRPLHLVHELVW